MKWPEKLAEIFHHKDTASTAEAAVMLPSAGEKIYINGTLKVTSENTLFPGTITLTDQGKNISVNFNPLEHPDIRVFVVRQAPLREFAKRLSLPPQTPQELYDFYKEQNELRPANFLNKNNPLQLHNIQAPYQIFAKRIKKTPGGRAVGPELFRLSVDPQDGTTQQLITERVYELSDFPDGVPIKPLTLHAALLFTTKQAEPVFAQNIIELPRAQFPQYELPISFTVSQSDEDSAHDVVIQYNDPEYTDINSQWVRHIQPAVIVINNVPYFRNVDTNRLLAECSVPADVIIVARNGRKLVSFNFTEDGMLTHFEGAEEGTIITEPSGGGRRKYAHEGLFTKKTRDEMVISSLSTKSEDSDKPPVDEDAERLERLRKIALELGIPQYTSASDHMTHRVKDPTLR